MESEIGVRVSRGLCVVGAAAIEEISIVHPCGDALGGARGGEPHVFYPNPTVGESPRAAKVDGLVQAWELGGSKCYVRSFLLKRILGHRDIG